MVVSAADSSMILDVLGVVKISLTNSRFSKLKSDHFNYWCTKCQKVVYIKPKSGLSKNKKTKPVLKRNDQGMLGWNVYCGLKQRFTKITFYPKANTFYFEIEEAE